MKYFLPIIFLLLCSFVHEALAHGVSGQIITTQQPIGVEFLYSTGEPAPYAKIEVYSPENKNIEYQNARTDKFGRFAFIPNTQGTWTIIMSDNVGHRTELPITLTEDDILTQASTTVSSLNSTTQICPIMAMPLWLRALLGVSLLFNIFIGLFIILKYRKPCHAHK
ncbi:hypothetical protein BW722_04675 [Lawsonia intracellularis]|uniref:hypothetical protein n=1 Tax=Lawsonia intracellularis TaxID=29546 RepID=UPI00097565B7|nr:hypothetical protein [Lawsonia intracellularis]OMQ03005.1 hypothetical protein BW722_04675 [Lawsonia intracellularis]